LLYKGDHHFLKQFCFHIGTSYLFQFGLRSKGTPAAFGHEEKKNLT
jgi:hypothetical protein